MTKLPARRWLGSISYASGEMAYRSERKLSSADPSSYLKEVDSRQLHSR